MPKCVPVEWVFLALGDSLLGPVVDRRDARNEEVGNEGVSGLRGAGAGSEESALVVVVEEVGDDRGVLRV